MEMSQKEVEFHPEACFITTNITHSIGDKPHDSFGGNQLDLASG